MRWWSARQPGAISHAALIVFCPLYFPFVRLSRVVQVLGGSVRVSRRRSLATSRTDSTLPTTQLRRYRKPFVLMIWSRDDLPSLDLLPVFRFLSRESHVYLLKNARNRALFGCGLGYMRILGSGSMPHPLFIFVSPPPLCPVGEQIKIAARGQTEVGHELAGYLLQVRIGFRDGLEKLQVLSKHF